MRGIKAGLVAAFLVALVALGGCAANTGANLRSGVDENADWVMMSRISQDAKMRGHHVTWVHPPQKKTAKTGSRYR